MWNGITNCRGGTLRRGQCDNNEVTKQASQNIGNVAARLLGDRKRVILSKKGDPCFRIIALIFNCHLIIRFLTAVFYTIFVHVSRYLVSTSI